MAKAIKKPVKEASNTFNQIMQASVKNNPRFTRKKKDNKKK